MSGGERKIPHWATAIRFDQGGSMSELKVGDTVKVEFAGLVIAVGYAGVSVECQLKTVNVPFEFCTLIEPPLKVGDKVRTPSDHLGRVTGCGEYKVLVLMDNGVEAAFDASGITRIEKP